MPMISIEQALEKVRKTVQPTATTIPINIQKGLGYILSEDIYSPIDMPPFRQSAMDGYAVNIHKDASYKLIGEIKAGDPATIELKQGKAVRIFTGAAVPDSANAVLIQERVTTSDGNINTGEDIKAGQNIRPAGEQVKKGDRALPKGTKLNAAAIGYLASLGLSSATVYARPSVGIVTTGNELTPPGQPLPQGHIYESNSVMLSNALIRDGYRAIQNYSVRDDYNSTLNTLRSVIQQHEMTIISGGISVGDYDFVSRALDELGVRQHFYKVFQKPGKPLYFGSLGSHYIFALPGNPAASLTCYYLYVLLALERLSGNLQHSLTRTKALCQNNFATRGDRPQFLKAYYNNGKVTILEGQNSSMLHTFARANALVFKPETKKEILKDELVETILLP